jgi:putative peptide zinc metalloprotease protein
VSAAPKLRTDLTLVEQTYRGEQSFILKDPRTRKYFRFRPVEVNVIQQFDGTRSAAEIAEELVASGLRVSAGAVEGFAGKLKTMGLLERTLGERSVLMMERLRAQRRQRLATGPFKGDILRLRWSVGDPDHFMDRTIPYIRWMFTRGFLVASVFLFAIYLLIIALKWPELTTAFGNLYHFRYSAWEMFVLWSTATVIIVVHELGHGYTCKHFGGQVHEIGAMLLYFEPAFFCNVNDAWTFPELKARLWVTAAGSWIQLVAASLAAIVWWATDPNTLISHIALSAVLIGGVTTVVMNANPLIPLDGYFALSDYLEVPNLRQRAFAHLGWLVKTRVFRLELPAPPADEREQRIFFIYGVLGAWYISSIMLVVAGTVYGWLDRALGLAGGVLFALGVWMLTRQAIRGAARTAAGGLRELRARLATRPLRDRIFAGVAGVVVLGAIVPRPITVAGPFTLAPALSLPLTAPDSGIVSEVYVRQGTRVEAGMPLVELRDLDMERTALATTRRVDSLSAREAQARAAGRTAEVGRLAAERATDAARLEGMTVQQQALTIRALAPGVVTTRRPEELGGQWVSLGQPLVELGQPDSLEVRIALTGAGATRVRTGQRTRLVFHADGRAMDERVTGVAQLSAAGSGAVEARIGMGGPTQWRPGMTGEASVTIRQSNVWGSLWWGIRKRVRTDLLL